MKEFTAKIIDPIGFHARPAAKVVNVAEAYKETKITVEADGKVGNLKSIMNIMAMGLKTNTEIRVVAEGPEASVAIEAIKKVMKSNKLISNKLICE